MSAKDHSFGSAYIKWDMPDATEGEEHRYKLQRLRDSLHLSTTADLMGGLECHISLLPNTAHITSSSRWVTKIEYGEMGTEECRHQIVKSIKKTAYHLGENIEIGIAIARTTLSFGLCSLIVEHVPMDRCFYMRTRS